MDSIRIGRISYTNVWPIFHHFSEDHFKDEIQWQLHVPTELNRSLKEGLIDMAPISAFAYGASFEQYMLFPNLSVSADSHVKSILLFHREPLELLKHARIALPTTSATSVNLLKMILAKFYGGEAEYEYVKPDLKTMLHDHDAALLIGDDAIRASWEIGKEWLVTDLGELWHRLTGHGMTFAVWAIRKEAIEQKPDLIARIYRAFLVSKQKGLKDRQPLVEKAVGTVGGTPDYWHAYFAGLCCDFGMKQWKGLQLYFQYAWELGLLNRAVPLHIWQDGKHLNG